MPTKEYINRIIQKDCNDFMDQLCNESIKLTITSPPYGNIRKYNGFKLDIEKTVNNLFRITENNGIVVWVVGDQVINGSESGESFIQALCFMKAGFRLHDTMIYMKDSISFPETNRYSQVFEYMFVFSKGKPSTVNLIKDRKNIHFKNKKKITGGERQQDGVILKRRKGNLLNEFGCRYNVWQINTGYGKSSKDKIAYNHPAIFPEKLSNDHILSWSNENDIIFDPFMGSGTTIKSAILNKRRYIGCDISNEYVEIASQRINKYI